MLQDTDDKNAGRVLRFEVSKTESGYLSDATEFFWSKAVSMNGEWSGGPCPQCGEYMPARVVHCQSCRVLLNSELTEDSVEIPLFKALPELAVIAAAAPKGHYVICPGCNQELRIHTMYRNLNVKCKHCDKPFTYAPKVVIKAFYAQCPHCANELRAAMKYMGSKVVCRHCDGHIQLLPEPP